jgi:hypothetical protein
VNVYNINKGRNPGIEARSPVLSAYARLVYEARRNEDAGIAVRQAVRLCIKEGVLADFFKKHGSEVESMLLTGGWAAAVKNEDTR